MVLGFPPFRKVRSPRISIWHRSFLRPYNGRFLHNYCKREPIQRHTFIFDKEECNGFRIFPPISYRRQEYKGNPGKNLLKLRPKRACAVYGRHTEGS